MNRKDDNEDKSNEYIIPVRRTTSNDEDLQQFMTSSNNSTNLSTINEYTEDGDDWRVNSPRKPRCNTLDEVSELEEDSVANSPRSAYKLPFNEDDKGSVEHSSNNQYVHYHDFDSDYFPLLLKKDYGFNSTVKENVEKENENEKESNDVNSTTTFKQRMQELRRGRGSTDHTIVDDQGGLNLSHSISEVKRTSRDDLAVKDGDDRNVDYKFNIVGNEDDVEEKKNLTKHLTNTVFGTKMRSLRRLRSSRDTTSITLTTRQPNYVVEKPKHVSVRCVSVAPSPVKEYTYIIPVYQDIYEIEVIEDEVVEVVEECSRLEDEYPFQLNKCYCHGVLDHYE